MKSPLFKWLSDWVSSFSVKSLIVTAIFIATAVLTWAVNVGLPLWKEYRNLKQVPTININSHTSYSIFEMMTFDQIFGRYSGLLGTYPPQMPTYRFPLIIGISNPTNQKTSFSKCKLRLGFHHHQGEYESDSYITPEALETNSYEVDPVLTLKSMETKPIELLFIFVPTTELEDLLRDPAEKPFRFSVICENEAGEHIKSTAHRSQ